MKSTFQLFSFLSCLFVGMTNYSNAQNINSMPFAASMDTFQTITGITVDALNMDDMCYNNIPIGFNFVYGGISHNKIAITTNGWLDVDSVGNSMFTSPLNNTNNNVISPFGGDLRNGGAGSSLQYTTIGTAPNRIMIIQWEHYKYFGSNTGDLNFQVWLYETSNCIRFVYGVMNIGLSPFNTQIGIRGASNTDYSVLDDSSCNWALAQPSNSINTIFPTSTMCSMPPGFAFHWGQCANNQGVTFSYITGKTYNDINNNGVFDGADTGIANRILNITPGNYYVSSNAVGDFAFFFTDSSLTYTVTASPQQYWTFSGSSSSNISPQTQACSGWNFGYSMMPNVHDVGISCPNWTVQPGGGGMLPISYHNYGIVPESDTITMVLDPLLSFVSCNVPPTVINGQTLKWAYNNLAPGATNSFLLHLGCSTSAVLGNYTNSTLSIAPLATDLDTSNNQVDLHQLISSSFDPNEKHVSPTNDIEAGTLLHYNIHFQNTGNAPAVTVILRDTLDNGVDPMTLEITGSSHPMNFSMSGNGILNFYFYGIYLPDSGSNQEASNGWVSYNIRSKNNLTPGTYIYNRAGIYFDNNDVILTNTTENKIRIETSNPFISHNGYVYTIHPNPTKDKINLTFKTSNGEKVDIQLITMDGKIVYEEKQISSGKSMDLSQYPTGIYQCKISTNNSVKIIKVIKE